MSFHDAPALVPERTPGDRRGFTESQCQGLLRDALTIAAAFTGAQVALFLWDDAGTWYRDGSGLSAHQLAELESLVPIPGADREPAVPAPPGWQVLATLPLRDEQHRGLGTLNVLGPEGGALSEMHLEGLRRVADHVQGIVSLDRQLPEARNLPRAPGAATFVPGLVHELGSFFFGISASLDALEARFPGLPEIAVYAGNIRKSLDRMRVFTHELREFGHPQGLTWAMVDPLPLLRSAVEANTAQAQARGLTLDLQVEGTLPAIQADAEGLQRAMARLIDLLVQQEEPGGHVRLELNTVVRGRRKAIQGQVTFGSRKMEHLDLARLFEPFYFRSSGLGRLTLPGVRRVFECHGGSLGAGLGAQGAIVISFMLPA